MVQLIRLPKGRLEAFESSGSIMCGPHTADWMLRTQGEQLDSAARPSLMRILLMGVGPWRMVKMLRSRFPKARILDMSSAPIEYLHASIDLGLPVAIFVKGKPMHWLSVGGYDVEKKFFYVFDSRQHRYGKMSEDPTLPIGNAQMSYDELLSVWRGVPFFRNLAVVL